MRCTDVEADLILWPVTLESFPRDKQLFAPVVQNNPAAGTAVDRRPTTSSSTLSTRALSIPASVQSTIVGQRRSLADLIRLQLYGFSWAATGVDQVIPAGDHRCAAPISKRTSAGRDIETPAR